jgi:hypothetical protein
MKIVYVACLNVVLAAVLPGQWLSLRTSGIPRTADGKPNLSAAAPRTADGKPDLNGLWQFPVDEAIGNATLRNIGGLKPEEIQGWARDLVQQRAERFGKDNPRYKCLPEGPGYATGGGVRKFVQTPDMILILNEDLTFRQIFMDGRKLEPDPNPTWMGYSIGHWENDVLVVDSNGYDTRSWILDAYPHTEHLHITERYRRTDFGHLEISVTFADPAIYARPFTVPVEGRFVADSQLLESVCNDNAESGQEHWIGKLSDTRQTSVRVGPEILGKYVGVYKGPYIGGSRTIEITMSGDSLYLSLNGGPRQPIVPQSETAFSGTGLTYQFVRDKNGLATHIIEGHISGDYKYERQH